MGRSAAQSVVNPPLSNTGGKSTETQVTGEILIDALSFTFLLSDVEQFVSGGLDSVTQSADELVSRGTELMAAIFGPDLFKCSELKGKRNFFDHSLPFDDSRGFIAFGGNTRVLDKNGDRKHVEEKIQIYLPGEGTAQVTDWAPVAKILTDLNASITRVDVAFDDHDGKRDVDYCMAEYDQGNFITRGAPPKAKHVDDMGSGEGRTFYVGNRKNGKMLRCYEKGKQLGDIESPWVRWELELHNKDREIPIDVLVNPQHYIAGAYPATAFIGTIQKIVKTVKEKAHIQYEAMVKFGRIAYGKLLNYSHLVIGLTPDQIFYDMNNPEGFPERLQWAT